MEKLLYEGFDGKKISMAVWDGVERPIGTIQIIHGMSEHIARYGKAAELLNSRGFIVAGDDHRAHGETDRDALGLAGEGDLFEKTVSDERGISQLLKERYGLPLVVLGHSYGSFVLQRYLTGGSNGLAGCVLCGSAFMSGIQVTAGRILADMKSRSHKDEPGTLFVRMTFDAYDKKFGKEAGAWLNRDGVEVEAYKSDPLCGFACSNGFYKYFFRGLKSIADEGFASAGAHLPVMILSGSDDCVGGRGKLVKKLAEKLRKDGLNPEVKLYPEARHELAFELCRETFLNDVADFATRCCRC